jgi:hypothetical protein
MWGTRRAALVVAVVGVVGAADLRPAHAALASAPRQLRTSYSGALLSVAWTAPSNDGGNPVTGYDMWLTISGSTTYRRQTATTYAVPARAGASVALRVHAITGAGAGDDAYLSSTADLGEAVALDSMGHVRRRYVENGAWSSLGGPVLIGTPFLARARSGVQLVVGGDSDGRIWGWTATSGWHVMSSTRCWRPAAAFEQVINTLTVGCVRGDGRLLATALDVRGSSVPTGLKFSVFSDKPLGRLAAVRHTLVFRVAAFDSAGHNVSAVSPFGPGSTKLGLACASDPGAGSGGNGNYDSGDGWAACLTSSTRLAWLAADTSDFLTSHRTIGSATLPFAAQGQPSLFLSRVQPRALIGVVGKDGVLRELDTAFRTWRVAGGLTVRPGISLLQYRG